MMNKTFLKITLMTLIIGFLYSYLYAADSDGSSVLKPIKVENPPVLDGVLDDDAWQTDPISENDFITYWPSNGDPFPLKTTVRVAYDSDNLYFAFYCYDSDPGRIKTSVCSRDRMWEDDWVGVGLDAIGNRQGLYGMFVNPSGIQGDLLRLASQGDLLRLASTDTDDQSVDWVWYCGARIVSDGYIVEIHIPLKSIRFQSGENVEMRVLFFRQITRLNLEGSLPEIPVGQGWLNSTQMIVFDKLNKQQKIEILPSVTSGSIWDRQSPDKWSSADTSNDIGFSAKYGITSSITAEAAYNPDFSQVESDAFQIQVNQRYPLFYTEKRPFFMESSNLFNVAGTGEDGNLRAAVHTRKIVDPQWGVKLTGEVGKTTFAFLGAGDEWAGRDSGDNSNLYVGKNAIYLVGRMKKTLSGENYIGALFAGKELGDSYNRVAGADFRFRFKKHHSLSGNFLYSMSGQPNLSGKSDGGSFHLGWDYNSKPLEAMLFAEHFDKNFNMETAFYQRTGITNIQYYFCPLWYPNSDGFPWIRRLRIFTYGFYTYDWVTGMSDYFTQIVINPFMAWNGWFRVDANLWGESWGGTPYHKKFFRFWSSMQFTKWLNVFTLFHVGDSIYYHEKDHFMGDYINWRSELTLQPTGSFNQNFSYVYETLENPKTKKSQYNVHIFQSKTTYQFNEYFFVRTQIQYDSFRKVVLTDLLASFTLIPGTVVHLGYGSLHENLVWNNNQWLHDSFFGKYYQSSQSLFFKVSYLFRF